MSRAAVLSAAGFRLRVVTLSRRRVLIYAALAVIVLLLVLVTVFNTGGTEDDTGEGPVSAPHMETTQRHQAPVSGPTWKTVGPIGVDFRCDWNPCEVGGLRPDPGRRGEASSQDGRQGKAKSYRTVLRHSPSRISLIYKGQTIGIPHGLIDRKEELEPVIQHSFGFTVAQPTALRSSRPESAPAR